MTICTRYPCGGTRHGCPMDDCPGKAGAIDFHELAMRIERGEIKALSIKQPYPHHIFHDGKDVENRDWATRGRGWFIVHAGVSKSEIDKDDPKEMAMPRGGVVGMARIVDCVQQMESRWFFGKYGFVLKDAFPIDLVPCKGALGFFALPPEINGQVAEAVRAMARPSTMTPTQDATAERVEKPQYGTFQELSEGERYCTCCERDLSGHAFRWLELDQRTDTYHDFGDVPEHKSQGWFPFGLTCAKKLVAKETKRRES